MHVNYTPTRDGVEYSDQSGNVIGHCVYHEETGMFGFAANPDYCDGIAREYEKEESPKSEVIDHLALFIAYKTRALGYG